MNDLQQDLASAFPALDITILGINEAGFEAGNASICDGRDLPWLQDVAEQDVWTDWAVTYRDVVVLDGNNEVFGVFNVTSNSLAVPANYDTVRQLFLDAAATL